MQTSALQEFRVSGIPGIPGIPASLVKIILRYAGVYPFSTYLGQQAQNDQKWHLAFDSFQQTLQNGDAHDPVALLEMAKFYIFSFTVCPCDWNKASDYLQRNLEVVDASNHMEARFWQQFIAIERYGGAVDEKMVQTALECEPQVDFAQQYCLVSKMQGIEEYMDRRNDHDLLESLLPPLVEKLKDSTVHSNHAFALSLVAESYRQLRFTHKMEPFVHPLTLASKHAYCAHTLFRIKSQTFCFTDQLQSVEYLKQAVQWRYPPALSCMAKMCMDGKKPDVPKDVKLGFQYAHDAVEYGSILSSLVDLGQMYARGLGCTRDEKEAFQYYTRAYNMVETMKSDPDHYHPAVCILLADCYREGQGTTIDQTRAIELYERAYQSGNKHLDKVAYLLGEAYFHGIGGKEKHYQSAAYYYRVAASQGNRRARARLSAITRDSATAESL